MLAKNARGGIGPLVPCRRLVGHEVAALNTGITRRPATRRFAALLACLAFGGLSQVQAQVTLTEGTNFTIDASGDGRLAMDLLGGVWVLPARGGNATVVTNGLQPASRPRWSPDNRAIVYEARAAKRNELRIYRFEQDATSRVGSHRYSDQHPDWHPDGSRLVYASQRHDTGLDLWEVDLPTGLTWRISHSPGDESEPAWSADGRNLVYVHAHDDGWSLMLRRLGEPDIEVVASKERLSSPSWRPDGSLVSFMRHSGDERSIDMVILSQPYIERTLIDDDDLFVAPVAWVNRQQMVYAANGVIRKRQFDSWTSRTIPFRATIRRPPVKGAPPRPVRELPAIAVPDGRLVLRAARLYDGIGGGYQYNRDVVIDGGTITSIEERRDRDGVIVVDMGDLTVLPGYIDSYSSLPDKVDESAGPLLLSFGVTTLVAESDRAEALTQRWSGKEMPGPRVLAAATLDATRDDMPWLIVVGGDTNTGLQQRDAVDAWQSRGVPVLAETWQAGLGSGASLLLGGMTLPASPGGHRYQDMEVAVAGGPVTVISGLADAQTPGLGSLLRSRQARLLDLPSNPVRRFTSPPRLAGGATTIVLGSRPNGLAPGLGLHAEFRAVTAAGLTSEQSLRAAGVNAAAALGLGLQAGRIAAGSVADLVIVDGDPLSSIHDALNVVAVIRNGRFFSTIGLIERVTAPSSVE